MSVRYYMDVHVSSAITNALRAKGFDVLTAQEDGMEELSDLLLLARSAALNRVLFTQDKDFFAETTRRLHAGEHFTGVIYGKQDPMRIGQYIEGLSRIAQTYRPDEVADRLIYLPLRPVV